MRHAVAFALLAVLAAPVSRAVSRSTVTVLLKIEREAPLLAIEEMKREVSRVMLPAGIEFNILMESEMAPGEVFDDLVVVTIKGQCTLEQDPMLIDERGPVTLAYAFSSGTDILPFAVVSCDHVRHAVDPALWGGQHSSRDRLLGRALGRVVAHELFHVLERTSVHSKSGIFQPRLSGAQLIADEMNFTPSDITRLRRSFVRQ